MRTQVDSRSLLGPIVRGAISGFALALILFVAATLLGAAAGPTEAAVFAQQFESDRG